MLGRILLTIDSVALLVGAVIADVDETHIYNPRWPPHAKFHNGQTISLSIALGAATLYYTWGGSRSVSNLRSAAFTGSIYWLAGLSAALYPGSSGLDPEFGGPGFPQMPLFCGLTIVALGGWLLEDFANTGRTPTKIN